MSPLPDGALAEPSLHSFSPCPLVAMAAPSMVTTDGDDLVVRSVVSGDALFGTGPLVEEPPPPVEEVVPEEFLPQTRVKRNYSCSSCEFATQNPRVFLYHLRDRHRQKFKIYECPRCLYASRHSQKLHRHMHMVHVLGAGKRKPSARSLRRLKPKAAAAAAVVVEPPPPPVIEPEPSAPLSDDGSFKCSVCPFESKSQNALIKHERVVHLKKKFFRCSKCDYATHVRARYTKHVKYHSMPMIKCEICDFRTPYKWNLERHNKNHQGGGAFKCFMCNFTADIKQSLTVHELNHHADGAARRRYRVGCTDRRRSRDDNLDMLHLESSEAEAVSKSEINVSTPETKKFDKFDSEPRISSILRDAINDHGDEKPSLQILRHSMPPTISIREGETKKKRPPPPLIPIGPSNNIKSGGPVRIQTPDSCPTSRKKKSSSFFDKLQEKLVTGSTGSDLLCSVCGHQAKCLSELVKHAETLHPEEEEGSGGIRRDKHPMENKVFVWNRPVEAVDQVLDEHPLDYPRLQDKVQDDNIYIGTEIKPGYGTATVLHESSSLQPRPDKTTHLRKAYKCPHCEFWASTASRFHVHFVGHLNKRPFRCSLCQYSSNWRWDITKHIRLKTFRDPQHTGARVLLTDEAGMRDYAKYNRYLALIKVENSTPVSQVGGVQQMAQVTASRVRAASPTSDGNLPPPKKQRLCNTKKMWKCKKCQYRNSDRQVVLAHVRAHYYPEQQNQDDSTANSPIFQPSSNMQDANPQLTVTLNNGGSRPTTPRSDVDSQDTLDIGGCEFVCETCPYECDSLTELEQHAEKHFVSYSTAYKCPDCPYYADSPQDLSEHAELHDEKPMDAAENRSVLFACLKCPYIGRKRSQLRYHKKCHGGSGAHACPKPKCFYTAPTNTLLALHVRLHRYPTSSSYLQQSKGGGVENEKETTKGGGDISLVWVLKGLRISKMFKCRFCPHVNIRKPVIQDHERMHSENRPGGKQPAYSCVQCSYVCSNAGNLASHIKVHQAVYGSVCGVVETSKSDEEQVEEFKKKMVIREDVKYIKQNSKIGMDGVVAMIQEDGSVDGISISGEDWGAPEERLIHFCSMCPARFLYSKELLIHSRFHVLKLPFKCQTCSYTARQRQHLFIHNKVHTEDYHERTETLLLTYDESVENPRPELVLKNDSVVGPMWVVGSPSASGEIHRCSKCPEELADEASLERHSVLHGSQGKFRCDSCDFATPRRDQLMHHEAAHNTYRSRMSEHKKRYVDPEFGTDIQGSPDFVYPTSMRNGKKKEKRYKCHKCPTAFEKRDQYKIHMALHGAKQRYSCEKCDYSVKYYANFIQHMKKHSLSEEAGGIKSGASSECSDSGPPSSPIKSEDVGSVSASSGSGTARKWLGMCLADEQAAEVLRRRKDEHRFTWGGDDSVGGRLHRCPRCPHVSTRRESLLAHIKCHSSLPPAPSCAPYSCTYCDFTAPNNRSFKEHVKTHFTPSEYSKPESYMKIDKLEIWAEEAESKFLVFKDSGENSPDPLSRFLPKTEPTTELTPPVEMRGRIYINLKTGEEEVELDDEIKQVEEEVEAPCDNGDEASSSPLQDDAVEEHNDDASENNEAVEDTPSNTSPIKAEDEESCCSSSSSCCSSSGQTTGPSSCRSLTPSAE